MRKTTTTLAIGFAWLCLGWLAANAEEKTPAKAHPDVTGWKSLFTDNLSNAVFPKGVWSFKDGVLTATKDEAIWTKKEYERFIVDVEFKTETNTNSGVFVYCYDIPNWITNAIEVQILDDNGDKWAKSPANWKCGGIFGRVAPTKSAVKKPGEWNRMTITCDGPKISVLLNGELVTEMDMKKCTSATKNPDGSAVPKWIVGKKPLADAPTKGHIGLQGKHAGVPIYFRNMKIKSID